MKKDPAIAIGMGVAVLVSGCVTAALWDVTDPRGQVWLEPGGIAETELERQGVPYTKLPDGSILISKTAAQQRRDWAFRTLATPVTVAVDGVLWASMVGLYVLAEDPYLIGVVLEGDRAKPPGSGPPRQTGTGDRTTRAPRPDGPGTPSPKADPSPYRKSAE